MMGIGGARPVVVAGGGGGGAAAETVLMGVASIKRTADCYQAPDVYQGVLRNCVYEESVGTVGALDSVTGRIAIPDGVKLVKLSLYIHTHGNTRALYGRIRTDVDLLTDPFGYCYRNLGAPNKHTELNGIRDVQGCTYIEPVIYVAGGSMTFDADNPILCHVGAVEFYG